MKTQKDILRERRRRARLRMLRRRRARILKGSGIALIVLMILCIPFAVEGLLQGMGQQMIRPDVLQPIPLAAAEAHPKLTLGTDSERETPIPANPLEGVEITQESAPTEGPKATSEPAKATSEPAKTTPEPSKATPEPPKPTPKPANATLKPARRSLDPDKKMVALTFDDGPYTPVTGKILDVLEQYDARATFFVLGSRAEDYSKVLKRAYDGGNQIGTHTYGHKNLTKLSKEGIRKEIAMSSEAIAQVIGEEPTVLRPPFGAVNDRLRGASTLPMINWSVDSKDWKSKKAKKVIREVLDTVKDGDIVLMHDLYSSTAEAVKTIVPELVKRGYQLVTVEELYELRGDALDAGTVHYKNPAHKK